MYEGLLAIFAVYGLGCCFAGASLTLLAMQLYRMWQRREAQECHQADTGKIVAFRGRQQEGDM